MQGDLISRSELIEYLKKSQSTSAEREHMIKVLFVDMVQAQPIAYDVEKVVHDVNDYFKDCIDSGKYEAFELLDHNAAVCDIVRYGGNEKR